MQMQMGSISPFFSLPYPVYAKWLDNTWVTSIWKFAHKAKLGINVEKQWLPWLAREHDAAIMDVAIWQKLADKPLYNN
jgi:hypothetical protein